MTARARQGARLLDELHAAFNRYVVLPSAEAADGVVLWVAATHGQAAWEHATRLCILSPEKRCGKSRLLDVIEATCRHPLITVNISPAALVRSVGDDPPALLLDEADTVFGPKTKDQHEDLRGILNAGHQRNRPYVRWDAAARRREDCPTFAMAALAAIGGLPGTITDRGVIVKMRRRAPGEVVAPYRQRRDGPALHLIRDRLTGWVQAHLDALRAAEPLLPVEDRAADTWEPLVALADLAGGDWPMRARTAARVLVADAEEDDSDASMSMRLLLDLREVFTWAGDPVAIFGDVILGQLHSIDGAPWSEFFGGVLTARGLARLLRPYDIRPREVKIGGQHRKGYRRDDLIDAWERYLPPLSATSATSATSQLSLVADDETLSATSATPSTAGRGGRGSENPSATPLASKVAEVAAVADTPPGNGRRAAQQRKPHKDGCPGDHPFYGDHGRPCTRIEATS